MVAKRCDCLCFFSQLSLRLFYESIRIVATTLRAPKHSSERHSSIDERTKAFALFTVIDMVLLPQSDPKSLPGNNFARLV